MKIPVDKLPQCHIAYPDDADYIIEKIPARQLLDSRRMDFYAKLLYIDHYIKKLDMAFARELYLAHVAAVTGYTNAEKGNPEKNTAEKFISTFENLIDNISVNGFNPEKSLIPVDADGYVVDGAHRVCIAAYFDMAVTVIHFKDWRTGYSMNWQWLDRQLLPLTYQDTIALEFCRWHENLYMACLWPQSFTLPKEKEQADKLIEGTVTIVYRRKVKLNSIGLRNFLMQIYGHMDWIGNVDNHFAGVNAKLKEVEHKGIDKVEFYLLEADSYETIFNLKQEVRKIYNIGLSSIHITDNIRETRQIADLIFNPNSFHHITHSYPDKFKKSYSLLMEFKSILKDNDLDWHNYVIDSSMVMAIYGIREARDLDYMTVDQNKDEVSLHSIEKGSMECHEKYAIFHGIPIPDMIYNPQNYFVFNEIKFLTLKEIRCFKNNKGEGKDRNDIRLINAYIENDFVNRMKMILFKRRHDLMVFKHRYFHSPRHYLIILLRRTGLFEISREIYRKYFKK